MTVQLAELLQGKGSIKMGKYFGTDGFRGEANINLTVEHAYKVGRFLGWYFGKEHRAQIVISTSRTLPASSSKAST